MGWGIQILQNFQDQAHYGPGTLWAKHLYEWFQQYEYRFRVIIGWGIQIWQNFQDQAHSGPDTLGAKHLYE
jgi:hypothetical protein